MKILIIEDKPLRSLGLALIVKEHYPYSQIIECGSISEAVVVLEDQAVSVVLLDNGITPKVNLTTIKSLKKNHPNIRVLILSAFDELTYALNYIHAGLDGVLPLNADSAEIQKALYAILKGDRHVSERIMDMVLQDKIEYKFHPIDPIKSLSVREMQMIFLLVENKTPQQIAQLLQLREGTIRLLRQRVFRKLKVNTLKELSEKVQLLS